MQNKGAIKVFAIALILAGLYQLSFTWFTQSVEKDAKEYAKKYSQNLPDSLKTKVYNKKRKAYLDSISGKTVFNFIGLRKYTYKDCKEREINLGLDLKGGMNVTLEVSVVDVLRSLANNSQDPTFLKAIKLAKQKQQNSQSDFITLFGEAFSEIDPNAKLASVFNTIDLKDKINYNSTNQEVLKVLKKETDDAIDNSINIIRSRIDRFGVSQPNVQELATKGRVSVELPGIKDPERVRKLLQGTANLEFYETYDNRDVYKYFIDINKLLKDMQDAEKDVETSKDSSNLAIDSTITSENKIDKKDTTKTNSLVDQLAAKKDSTNELVKEINKESENKDSLKTKEQIARSYPLFSVLNPNTTRDGKLVEGAAVGISHFKDTAQVMAYLKMKQVKAILPRDIKFCWTVKPLPQAEDYYQLIALKVTTRDGKAPLGGDVITDARPEFGNNKATAEVSMTMNAQGAAIWARLTKANIGKQIAIVLDNYVYSYPTVQGEIKGGRSSITGNFTINEAKDLANILKSGKLPAPARIIEEAIVGPSLGHKAVNAGLMSFIIAFLVVLIYMIFYYAKAGLAANIALLFNLFFIMGVLASLGAVLTLPGIAGIVLTIGMSVDANVLIYERIREEMLAGKGLKLAVNDGYKNAYSSIIDANVTTLLTGIILYVFGSGPIKGFATTLIIGILTSLFTAIFITRLVFIGWLKHNKKISFGTKLTNNAFRNVNIKFIQKRKLFYAISGVIILIGIISLVVRGLDYGVDFVGGRNYIVKFEKPVKTTEIQNSLKLVFGEMPEVKVFGESDQMKITTKYLIKSEAPDADDQVEAKLYEGLKSYFKDVDAKTFNKKYILSSQKVGPTIADDIKIDAVWAVLFSLLVIFLYILIRFKNWQFSLGAVLALAHDVLITIGLFSIFYGILPFSLEIDQAFIAAILTVVGYSINDTVVVFDRIREFVTLHPKRNRVDIINNALNSTISRTINTSLTTFIVLLIIFIFGGEVIRGFIFALLIGVVVGTYSSLFVASPIAYDTMKKGLEEDNKKAKK